MNVDLPRDRFGDTDAMNDALAQLVVRGLKTASCDAYRRDTVLLKVGDQTLIEDSMGYDVCIIETTEVQIIPFHEVDASYARDEGEGDLSLDYWRREHQAYFERNGGFSPDMLLMCERFKVIRVF